MIELFSSLQNPPPSLIYILPRFSFLSLKLLIYCSFSSLCCFCIVFSYYYYFFVVALTFVSATSHFSLFFSLFASFYLRFLKYMLAFFFLASNLCNSSIVVIEKIAEGNQKRKLISFFSFLCWYRASTCIYIL